MCERELTSVVKPHQSHSGVSLRKTHLSLSAFRPYCYFKSKRTTLAVLCQQAGTSIHWNIIKSNANCCCCCCCGKHPPSSERRSCTSKRVSVILLYSPLDYTSWAHQNHRNYSHFALIYSNAVSYLWGNYEQFFFFARRISLCWQRGQSERNVL